MSGQLPSEINDLTQMTSLLVAATDLTAGDMTALCKYFATTPIYLPVSSQL